MYLDSFYSTFALVCFSPIWVQDIVDLLEKVYSNAIYAEAHPDPEGNIIQLEDSIKVGIPCSPLGLIFIL